MSALAKQPMEGAILKPAFHTLHQIPSCKSHHLFTDILRTRGGAYICGGGNGRYDDYGGNDADFESGRYDEDRYNDRYGSRDDPDYYGDGYRDECDDAAPSKIPRRTKSAKLNLPDMGGILRKGDKKIGMMLLGGGTVFTLLGMSLFFNKTLMRMGNLLFIIGVPMTIGPGRTAGYFLQPKKARATGCLGTGIFLVMVGWPILGIALEIFGLLNLFGNMFPFLMVILKQMPVVGTLLEGTGDGGNKKKKKAGMNGNRFSSRNEERGYSYEDEDQDYYGSRDGHQDRGTEGDYRGEDRYSKRPF